ncbi:Misexpression suppressor of ras 6 [Carabus blaptoides fortunei]
MYTSLSHDYQYLDAICSNSTPNNADGDCLAQNGVHDKDSKSSGLTKLEKIPFKFMDMHHDVYNLVIKPYIEEENILPKTGITVIHFDGSIDNLAPEDMQLRLQLQPSTPGLLFDNIGIEYWLKNMAEDGYLKHVVWFKPPWTKGVNDGHRNVCVKSESGSEHEVILDIRTLGRSVFEDVEEDFQDFQSYITEHLSADDPYVIDLELNFFSADNTFTEDHDKCPEYYKKLYELFKIKEPASMSSVDIQVAAEERKKQLNELEEIFKYMHENKAMPSNKCDYSENYKKVSKFREELLKYYEDTDRELHWQHIFDAGRVCNDYQLPVHYTERSDIEKMVKDCVGKILNMLPSPPLAVTVAIMYDYCRQSPEKDLDFIIELLKDLFNSKYNMDCANFIGY